MPTPATTPHSTAAVLMLSALITAGCSGAPAEDRPEQTDQASAAFGVRPKHRPPPPRELDDPCNATIVTVDPELPDDPDNPKKLSSITINDFCEMIKSSGKKVTVFNTQCYGGGAVECCGDGGGATPGGEGCHHAGGHSGEPTAYGQYDMGVAGALKPGAAGGDIHQAGADNTTSTTPESSCEGQSAQVGANDTVITFAGDPLEASGGNPSDHDIGQQVSDNNTSTVNLEGDGSSPDVEGPATSEALADAINSAAGDTVWILMLDHGNAGGPSVDVPAPTSITVTATVSFDSYLLDHMAADYGAHGWIVMQSDNAFPALTEVGFGGQTYWVSSSDARLVQLGGQHFYRYLLAVPEQHVTASNEIAVTNLTDPDTSFELFVDTGPIAKLGAALDGIDNQKTQIVGD